MKTLRILLLALAFVLLFLIKPVWADPSFNDSIPSSKKVLSIELDIENGGILANSDVMSSTFENAYYNGVNLRVGWKSKKPTKSYDVFYNNPTYGIGLYSSTFNNSIVGSPFALYGFIKVPFFREKTRVVKFDYRIGLGLAGNFTPFDSDLNPENRVISTENNVFIDFGFTGRYQISPKWKAGLGISFHHFSNGALRLPNKGINLLPITASVAYQLDVADPLPSERLKVPLPKEWLYHVNYGFGFKQIDKEWTRKYFKSTLSFYASRYVDYKWRLGGGVDLFYSSSGNSEKIAEDKSGNLSAKLSGGPAMYVSHVLNPRLVLNGNIGYYIHNQRFNGEIRRTFLRAGIRYYVYKNINAGVSIKAHLGKADFIEWSTGYTFGKRLF